MVVGLGTLLGPEGTGDESGTSGRHGPHGGSPYGGGLLTGSVRLTGWLVTASGPQEDRVSCPVVSVGSPVA